MKNLKRLIALVAVFALALTTIASAASFTDVADDSAYFKAVEQLHKIGIIDGYTDGTFGPEKTVTRSEMAKLIAAMQGYAESAEGKAVTKFSDVPSTHWASGYIAAATGVAIDGRPDGTFGPEEEVKYEDAVKMIMATLGYTVVANANGGYPMGYVSAAIKEGVTEDVVKAAVGTPASRGTIAQLLYNAIDTPLVEQITWNLDGSGDFIKYDGESKYAGEPVEYKTLMTENLGIVKGEGVIISTNFYGFEADNSIDKEDALAVDFLPLDYDYVYGANDEEFTGEAVLAADSGAENFLGKAVEFFAFQDKYDDWTLLSVVADEAYNKTVTFPITALDADKTADASALWYYKDGAKASTKIALDTEALNVMNNNILGGIDTLVAMTADDAADAAGFVTVIDNDKDAAFDAVIIETAVSAVVDEIDGDVIIFKEDIGIAEIDTDDDALLVKLVKDGAEIEADAIAEGDVLSLVYADGYAGYLVADVMQNTIEGTLTSTKASDSSVDDVAYKVDGKWYDAAYDGIDLRIGEAAKFYIDKFGRIAYVDETVTISGNYAYVTAFEAKANFRTPSVTVQMLTKDGVVEKELAKTIYIDGEAVALNTLVTIEEVEERFVVTDVDDAITGLVDTLIDVTYSGDTIKKINNQSADPEEEIVRYIDDFENAGYDAEDLEIGGVEFDEDTVVFFVPGGAEDFDKANAAVGTLADLEDSDVVSGKYYRNSKADENNILVITTPAGVNAVSGLAVITGVVETVNEDEEDVYELTALYNGEEVTMLTTNDAYLAADLLNIEAGDIYKFKVRGNVIVDLTLIMDGLEVSRANGYEVVAELDNNDGGSVVAGYATGINKKTKRIEIGDASWKLSNFDNIYVIDTTGKRIEISKGSSSSYKFDENFYDPEAAGKYIYINGSKYSELTDTVANIWEDVADFLIVRDFEGENTDSRELIIVKGASYQLKSVANPVPVEDEE